MKRPTVLLSIPNTLSMRNLLRTDVFMHLKAGAERIVIVAPFADELWFQEEFVRESVTAVPMLPYKPGMIERRLFSALYNLYLAGPTSHTLRVYLGRWADNHQLLGPIRQALTRSLLPALRWTASPLEMIFTRIGQVDAYAELIGRERPDVAVFSRLFYCDELPIMRAAVLAGIPTVGAVASWDNLTTKGPLLPRLDRLVVWNDTLKDEAQRFHGYRPADIVVTGAPHHDMVFSERERLVDRTGFFARLGLDPQKKLITYAGEDPAIAPDVPRYVEEIYQWVRNDQFSFPSQLLIRPHPQDDLRRYDRVRNLPGVVFDLPGRPSEKYWMDMSRGDLRHLCETLLHSDVVVNVTSTIAVDAAFFDTPSVCIGYDYSTPRTHFNSPMRYFEMDHFRPVIAEQATRLVESPDALRETIDRYLIDPSLDREGRQRIVGRIAQHKDGQSGLRTAEAILKASQAAAVSQGSFEGRNRAETRGREAAI
jgi:hypothetical protein